MRVGDTRTYPLTSCYALDIWSLLAPAALFCSTADPKLTHLLTPVALMPPPALLPLLYYRP